MSLVAEFKTFIGRGNVLDLAVGVIIGAAFGKIVSSLVEDLIMPVLGKLTGGVDFSKLYATMDGKTYATYAEAKTAGAALGYGQFVNNIVQFVFLAFAIFLLIKIVNRAMPSTVVAAAGPTPSESLLGEIRDLLKK